MLSNMEAAINSSVCKNEKEKKQTVDQHSNITKTQFEKLFTGESLAFQNVINMSVENGDFCEKNISIRNTVILIPGIEGSSAIMKPLVNNLNENIYCIQYVNQFPDSPQELIHYTIENIKPLMSNKSQLIIVGYSFGGWLAMEVVHNLEQREGKPCKLILIDSSPLFLKGAGDFWYKDRDDNELQIYICSYFLRLIVPEKLQQVIQELRNLKSFKSRIDFTISVTSDINYCTENYKKIILSGMYKRAKALSQLKPYPNKFISSQVTLIKPSDPFLKLPEDYGLSKYFTNTVDIHVISGNHYSMLMNKELADVIMKFC